MNYRLELVKSFLKGMKSGFSHGDPHEDAEEIDGEDENLVVNFYNGSELGSDLLNLVEHFDYLLDDVVEGFNFLASSLVEGNATKTNGNNKQQ